MFLHFGLFYFVSVLLVNINRDEKENHQVLVSFYALAHLTREMHKHQLDLGAPEFGEVKAGGVHLLILTQACCRGVQDRAGDRRRARPGKGLPPR